LPMPDSPRIRIAWPRPPVRHAVRAPSSWVSSALRPTKGVAAATAPASSTRVTRQTRSLRSKPLIAVSPQAAASVAAATAWCTSFEISVSPDAARSCSRAARFTLSPMTVYSLWVALPVPLATTWPLAMPI